MQKERKLLSMLPYTSQGICPLNFESPKRSQNL